MKQNRIKSIFLILAASFWAVSAYADSETQTLPISFSIEPVTAIRAQAPSGGPSVDLGVVVPGVELPAEILQVSILTNTEDPYRVYHELRNEMTNGSGTAVSDQNFRFMVTNGAGGGESAVPAWTPVPQQRSPLFSSRGGPATFMIHYTLSGKNLLEAGEYYGNVHITLENG